MKIQWITKNRITLEITKNINSKVNISEIIINDIIPYTHFELKSINFNKIKEEKILINIKCVIINVTTNKYNSNNIMKFIAYDSVNNCCINGIFWNMNFSLENLGEYILKYVYIKKDNYGYN